MNTENLILCTSKGSPVVIQLRDDLAPKHVERIKKLASEGFYNGIVFHRVIEGFMAQTGDPTGTGTGGSSYPDMDAEFTAENFSRGTVGMARSQNPNSANSQFFICYQDASFLNKQYTVFGQVIQGMEYIDQLNKGPSSDNGAVPVDQQDRIEKAYLSSESTQSCSSNQASAEHIS
ncbi:MAG TPA: peptidylprolyl isomerase [Gammaproteobacteria bacterium]|nr:peptidylprolyl isomerase [Gammaproteobacteria bacterium]